MTHPESPLELPALNSRWYISGHHWRVVRHTTRDGEPAVRLQCLTPGKRKTYFTWIWRLCVRGRGAAIPSSL